MKQPQPVEQEQSLPEFWDSWSEGEREEWREELARGAEATRLYDELAALVSPDLLMKISDYGDRRQDAVYSVMHRMEHRMARYIPGARDLIRFAGIQGMELRGDADR